MGLKHSFHITQCG